MRDISYIHVDMYCPKIKIVYFQLMLKQSAEDSLMVIEKMKQMNVTPDAITTTIQFHWASALVGIGVQSHLLPHHMNAHMGYNNNYKGVPGI